MNFFAVKSIYQPTMKKKYVRTLVALITLTAFLGCSKSKENPANVDVAKAEPAAITGNWDPFNKKQLENLINRYGKNSADYNKSTPPYVVFDWDNTSVFLDIQEASLIYQLENLVFGCTPSQLAVALKVDVPSNTEFALANTAGGKFKLNDIATDVVDSYTWLYQNYKGLAGGGTKTLAEVKDSPHYKNFIVKVRFMYEAIGATFSVDVSYPWVLYLYTGLSSAEIRSITRNTVEWQVKQPIASVTWTSPTSAELPNQLAGQVSVSWKNGLRLVPEMQDLYNKFRANGFDVWVCSASFVDVIKEISSNPSFGYNNDENRVLAMELQKDNNDRYKSQFRTSYDQTQGKGKTYTIQRFLSGPTGKYGYDPLFIAGDSDGDANMLQDFKGLKLGLIINRLKGKNAILGDLCKLAVDNYGVEGTKYILNGRNDNTGLLTPDQLFIKLGATTGSKLP